MSTKHSLSAFFISYVLCLMRLTLCLEPSQPYTGFRLFTGKCKTSEQLTSTKNILDKHLVDVWRIPKRVEERFVFLTRSDNYIHVISELRGIGVYPEVSIQDIGKFIENQEKNLSTRKTRSKSFDLDVYHTYDEIYPYLSELEYQYPTDVKVVDIGFSYENRSIRGVSICEGERGVKPVILLEAGIHAREWITTAVAIYIIQQLSSGIRKELTKYEWIIFPNLNPDGYHYTFTQDRLWRKNRSKSSDSIFDHCIGTDLNRNFQTPDFCGQASPNPCSDGYCGDFPFSAPESRAWRDYLLRLGSRTKAYFSLHSYYQAWAFPYAYTNQHAPNFHELERLSKIGVEALASVHGTNYSYGPLSSAIYPVSGSSIDWIYEVVGTQLVFILELRDDGEHGFLLPEQQIIPTAEETWHAITTTILSM